MEDFIQININQQLHKCFSVYGIEGTEDKIKSIYNKMPQLQEIWLEEYNKIILGEIHE